MFPFNIVSKKAFQTLVKPIKGIAIISFSHRSLFSKCGKCDSLMKLHGSLARAILYSCVHSHISCAAAER